VTRQFADTLGPNFHPIAYDPRDSLAVFLAMKNRKRARRTWPMHPFSLQFAE
jgi:hypothetical protein